MITMVNVAITKTCLHFRPRSSNHSASTGNGVSKAGLTKAATPQVVPHMIQSVKLLERANVIVSRSASPAIRADNGRVPQDVWQNRQVRRQCPHPACEYTGVLAINLLRDLINDHARGA